MTVKIGVTLPQFTDDAARFREGVLAVEESGLDSMWVFDHLWPLSGTKDRPILEGWTTLAWLAAITQRAEIGTLVTRSSLRHPALLAKMAATVACFAPGRVILGIGSGDEKSRAENEAFGIDYHAEDDRTDQLRSTVEALVRFLHEDEINQDDDFVSLTSLPTSPRPPISPPVWVGGRSGDAIEIAGTLADGWNGWGGTPERFAQDAGAALDFAEGRPFDLTWGGLVSLAASDEAAIEAAKGKGAGGEGVIAGSPGTVAAALQRFADTGATHLICTFVGTWDLATLDLLATEVAPALHS